MCMCKLTCKMVVGGWVCVRGGDLYMAHACQALHRGRETRRRLARGRVPEQIACFFQQNHDLAEHEWSHRQVFTSC
jgi:hypothetical protein